MFFKKYLIQLDEKVEFSDVVVLNKGDLVSDDQQADIRDKINNRLNCKERNVAGIIKLKLRSRLLILACHKYS